ncbi:type II secretion system protein [Chitinimonas arctica]|uniref:Type II secretion system protein n=1 Tax=Chitinimonas arctica TaxID=2594795 RepID=A0A516SC60_9NEIS|nr:type II secretion system protein [Chitinimonas arctica]QDQ25658.1 type II secretion system protein [Chitinimonas arctica]
MRRQHGFSYLVALFLVAILAVLTTRALENSRTAELREREAELLYVGQAYQAAIRAYYRNGSGSVRYPATLEALLLDQRPLRPQRPLRRLYRDPILASQDWGLVRAPSGGIMGVYSRSLQAPQKTDGFPAALANFKGATQYRDWQFIYQPETGPDAPTEPERSGK